MLGSQPSLTIAFPAPAWVSSEPICRKLASNAPAAQAACCFFSE
jgi:hypothetical protein